MNPVFDQVAFLGFDVFGTVVDWRTSVAREVEPFLARHAISVDPLQFASDWRGLYQPSMEEVRSGRRQYVTLDVLNRENLDTVLTRHGVDLAAIPGQQRDELTRAWERLDRGPTPWQGSLDSSAGSPSARCPTGTLPACSTWPDMPVCRGT